MWGRNERLFEAEKQLLEVRFSHDNRGLNLTQMQQTAEYQRILREWQKRRRMVVSEGLFFVLCLAYGLYSINQSANREVKLSRQRRNFAQHHPRTQVARGRPAPRAGNHRQAQFVP